MIRQKQVLAILVVLLAIQLNCRKIDTAPESLEIKAPTELERRFFQQYPPTNGFISGMRDFVMSAHRKHNIVEKIFDRIGLPVWNKALIYDFVETSSTGRDITDSFQIAHIPFVRDTQRHVNAALIIKAPKFSGGDTSYQFLCDFQYDDFSFGTVADTMWNAKRVFQIFAKLDNSVFGTEVFQIKDEGLLAEEDSFAIKDLDETFDSVRIYYNLDTTAYDERMGKFTFPVTECVSWSICLEQCPLAQGGGSQPARMSRSLVSCCARVYSTVTCITGWVNIPSSTDPGGGHSAPPTGSQTGSGGGWIPPDPGPGCNGIIERTFDPCSGWQGFPPGGSSPAPDPCDAFITSLENNTTFIAKCSTINSSSVVNLNYEKGYEVGDIGNNDYTEVQGSSNSKYIDWTINGSVSGLMHSHPANSNSIFSADDVYFMAKIFKDGRARDPDNLFFVLTSPGGLPYLIKVTDKVKFAAFANNIINQEEKDGRKFTATYNPLFDSPGTGINEKEFLKMLAKEGGVNGLTLYRGNEDCNQWERLFLDNFGEVDEEAC